MKVLFLSKLFYPHIGGVERHAEKLSQALITKGASVTVITSQHEKSIKLQDENNGIQVLRMPREIIDKKYYVWRWILSHKHLFAEADIVHVHDVYWWLIPLKFLQSTKVFTTFHGWEGHFPPKFNAKMQRKLAERGSLGNICVGDFISTWYGTNPDFVTYGATDQQPLVEGDKIRLYVIGRLSRDNDIPMVLESLRLLKERRPEMKITFLGDGNLAWEAEKIGLVLGFKKNLDEHLAKPRWVIASSYLSIIDAMASGRYVFSFHSNPLKKEYLVKHPVAGHFSQVSSPEKFIREFEAQYNHREATDVRISKAQAWALDQTWDGMADNYINLWKRHHPVEVQELIKDLDE